MNAASRRHEAELVNERRERQRLADELRRQGSALKELQAQLMSSRPELQSARDASVGTMQQARQLEHRVLATQQDALLWRNDVGVRLDQMRQDVESLKAQQRHRDENLEAVRV